MQRATELSRIFSTIRQAVIGIDSSSYSIIFANPVAVAAFGFDPTGSSAKEIISSDILCEDASNYLCGTKVLNRKASVSVVKNDAETLLYIDFLGDDKPALTVTRHMISSLRNSAMGIKMSADRCFSMIEEGNVPSGKYVSVLYHYYYTLLRTLIQIDSADLIERGEMLFSPVPTNLVNLCSDLTNTVSLLCADTGVKISFSTDERELIAVVDPSKIEQLLLNLYANSLQHTSAGNSVALTLSRSGNKLIISLDDDGDGIPQETLSNIFSIPDDNDGSVLRRTGNGLGLFIAFGIAQLHKGVILIESRKGGGTRVRVMLPTDEDPAPKFNCPEISYRHSGVSSALTELADILSSDSYGIKYED